MTIDLDERFAVLEPSDFLRAKDDAADVSSLVDGGASRYPQFFSTGRWANVLAGWGRGSMTIQEHVASPRREAPPRRSARAQSNEARRSHHGSNRGLVATIEQHIIPRLMLAHCDDDQVDRARGYTRALPTPTEVSSFADVVARQDLPRALAWIDDACQEGLSIENIFTSLIGPAARLLGDDWVNDRRSFADVTVGTGTLQQLVNVLGPRLAPPLFHRGTLLLAPAPREQHTLGLHILGELLRRAGWGVHVLSDVTSEIVDRVASEHVAAVGFTVSSEALFEPLQRSIEKVRRASMNEHLAVMVGGAIDVSAWANELGIFCGKDAPDAVRWLDQHARVLAP